jgi:hypothetical protein
MRKAGTQESKPGHAFFFLSSSLAAFLILAFFCLLPCLSVSSVVKLFFVAW